MNTKPEKEEGDDSDACCSSSEEEIEPPASNKKVLKEIEDLDKSPDRKQKAPEEEKKDGITSLVKLSPNSSRKKFRQQMIGSPT